MLLHRRIDGSDPPVWYGMVMLTVYSTILFMVTVVKENVIAYSSAR